jgi:Putative polyhydroxyalkanoic acid system protein (PHA_gran_rgn)
MEGSRKVQSGKARVIAITEAHPHLQRMSKPVMVTISHSVGKDEAVRRLKSGLRSAPASFRHVFAVQEEVWTGDHLQFRVSAIGQIASGTIDVAEDNVRLVVELPWLLAQFAEKMQPLIRNQGKLMLDKK